MKKNYLLLLLAVFTACTNSIVEENLSINKPLKSDIEDKEISIEKPVPIEEVLPIMTKLSKSDYETMLKENTPDNKKLITLSNVEETPFLTRANDYTITKIEYNRIEDLSYITMKGITDYKPEIVKKAVTVDQNMANRWDLTPGNYYVYSWKLTLVYQQARNHDFVIGTYAGIKPSDRESFGYDIEKTGTNQWTVTTMYYRYERRTSNDAILSVTCMPSTQYNDPGSFYKDFRWQYTVQGNLSSDK